MTINKLKKKTMFYLFSCRSLWHKAFTFERRVPELLLIVPIT